MIMKMQNESTKYINPKEDAADEWKKNLVAINDSSLFPTTKSTYMGGSIPDKVFEPVCYPGGIPGYARIIRKAMDTMKGFEVVSR